MKKVLSILLVGLMLFGITACADATKDPTAQSTSPASAAPAETAAAPAKATDAPVPAESPAVSDGTASGSKGVIGVGLFYRRDEFYIDVESRLTSYLKELGYETRVFDCDTDMAKLVSAIEDFTTQKVDGIICSGSNLIVSAVENAVDQGIPVVCFDGTTNSEKVAANVVYDPAADGKAVGEWAKAYIAEHWPDEEVEVAVLDFPASAEICVGRTNAFIDVIKTIPNAKIVAQMDGKASRADSMAAAETILQANPNIKLAYGINFDTIAGFYAALDAIKKTDTVLCSSGSWGEEAIQFLSANHPQYKAFTLMNPWHMAEVAVDSMVSALEGKPVDQDQNMDAVTYTAETIGTLDYKEIIEGRIK